MFHKGLLRQTEMLTGIWMVFHNGVVMGMDLRVVFHQELMR